MSAVIRETTLGGFRKFTLENETARVAFLPELGGKMIEMTELATGAQYLLEPQSEDGEYRRARVGDPFDQFDVSGFDECFPTIADCRLKLNGEEIDAPDHGEVWSRPWEAKAENDALLLAIDGLMWNYRLEKRVRLVGARVEFDYRLTNGGGERFPFLWSAHPLLKIEEGAEIRLPSEADRVFVNWASDAKLGTFGETRDWPRLATNGSAADYSIAPDEKAGVAAKVFTERLTKGAAEYYLPSLNRVLRVEFDVEASPYVGVWLCYGGWPPEEDRVKHRTAAIEPANGRPDSLAEAIKSDECGWIEPGETKTWRMAFSIHEGKTARNNGARH
jgi:galactose mutarotase-like enzyme